MKDLAYYQGEIAQELRRRGMEDMQAILTSQWIAEQIIAPAIRHERIRIEQIISRISLTKTETLDEVGLLDSVLTTIAAD